MKKIVIYSMLSAIAITLVGCSGASSANSIKELNAQLNRVESSIECINQQDLTALCRNSGLSYQDTYQQTPIYTNSLNLLNLQNKVSNDIVLQDKLGQQIGNQIDQIQETLKSNTKYNSNQVKAINNFTSQLSNYATKLKNSKDEVKEGLRIINYNQNINHMSLDQLNSGYNSISNVLETRKAYFFNLANTLTQLEGVLNNQLITQDNTENENKTSNLSNNNINIPNQVDQTPIRPIPRTVENNYPYFQYGYGNNGYGFYPYGRNAFNPNRNTDTYRPNYVNIDTYRYVRRGTFPNGQYEIQYISTEPLNEDDLDFDLEIEEKQDDATEKLLNQNKEILAGKKD